MSFCGNNSVSSNILLYIPPGVPTKGVSMSNTNDVPCPKPPEEKHTRPPGRKRIEHFSSSVNIKIDELSVQLPYTTLLWDTGRYWDHPKTFDVWEAFLEIVVKVRVSVRMFGIGSVCVVYLFGLDSPAYIHWFITSLCFWGHPSCSLRALVPWFSPCWNQYHQSAFVPFVSNCRTTSFGLAAPRTSAPFCKASRQERQMPLVLELMQSNCLPLNPAR
uniref:Uncharacterized protein n=1 Tax=Glossina pallidipes TaxID=7398 RepID=A0A1A9ZHJ9_GLOPL